MLEYDLDGCGKSTSRLLIAYLLACRKVDILASNWYIQTRSLTARRSIREGAVRRLDHFQHSTGLKSSWLDLLELLSRQLGW